MNKERFNKLLKESKITKTDFAKQFKLTVGTVNNWGSSKEIPYWVESWLENYIEKEKFESMKDILRDSGVCDG